MTAWKKLRRLPSFILQTASQVFRLSSLNVRCGGAGPNILHPSPPRGDKPAMSLPQSSA
jgi:hypothetical protein